MAADTKMSLERMQGYSMEDRPVIRAASWSSGKLYLVVYGLFILVFGILITIIQVSSILSLIILAIVGVAVLVFASPIGLSIYEANRRSLIWLWKNLWRMQPAEIEKKHFGAWNIPYGYKFNVLIIRVIGSGLVIFSVIDILGWKN